MFSELHASYLLLADDIINRVLFDLSAATAHSLQTTVASVTYFIANFQRGWETGTNFFHSILYYKRIIRHW